MEDNFDVEIDNSNIMVGRISNLFGNHHLSDICLEVQGQEYYVHRIILCISSNVFNMMLADDRFRDAKQSRLTLNEEHSCCEVFRFFLQYLYTGKIRINPMNVIQIFMLSDKYEVKDLMATCENYMNRHAAHGARNSRLLNWLDIAARLGKLNLAQSFENYIKWNFAEFCKSNDFKEISVEMLERLLMLNDLIVPDEMFVFRTVITWLEYQWSQLERMPTELRNETILNHVRRLVPCIKFPMMSRKELEYILGEAILGHYPIIEIEFIVRFINIGLIFHSDDVAESARMCQLECCNLQHTPRLYSDEKWTSTMTFNEFHSLTLFTAGTMMVTIPETFIDKYTEETFWVIDFFPKGVHFEKFFLINLRGTIEMPEWNLNTVRAKITCNKVPEGGIRVKIGLLVWGLLEGIEQIISVCQVIHEFNTENNILTVDDVVPSGELNTPPFQESRFLIGPNRDTFKVSIAITPLCEEADTDLSTLNTIDMWINKPS